MLFGKSPRKCDLPIVSLFDPVVETVVQPLEIVQPIVLEPVVSTLEPVEIQELDIGTDMNVATKEPEIEEPTPIVIAETRHIDIDTGEVVAQSDIVAVPKQKFDFNNVKSIHDYDILVDNVNDRLRTLCSASSEDGYTYGIKRLRNNKKDRPDDWIVGHIFGSSYDLWIADYDEQDRVFFGFASFGGLDDPFAEWGYVGIDELLECGAGPAMTKGGRVVMQPERDFYWTPCTLASLQEESIDPNEAVMDAVNEAAADAISDARTSELSREEIAEIIPGTAYLHGEQVSVKEFVDTANDSELEVLSKVAEKMIQADKPKPIQDLATWVQGVHQTYPMIERTNDLVQRKLGNYEALNENLTQQTVWEKFSGLGRLHDVKFEGNFHDYTLAKQEFEMGQFYTPDIVAAAMAKLMAPSIDSSILDMSCGMGRFFNFFPNQKRMNGFDIDSNALRIGRKLFPDVYFREQDLRGYKGYLLGDIDFCIGNPPFNIQFSGFYDYPVATDTDEEDGGKGNVLSQNMYLYNTWKYLKPAGISLMLVPENFGKGLKYSKIRNFIAQNFIHFADIILPDDAFKEYQCDVKTKVVVLAKRTPEINEEIEPITTTFQEFLDTPQGKLFLRYRKIINAAKARSRLSNIRREYKFKAMKKEFSEKGRAIVFNNRHRLGGEYYTYAMTEAGGLRDEEEYKDFYKRVKREIQKSKRNIGLWIRVLRCNHKIIIERGSPSISTKINEEHTSAKYDYDLTQIIVSSEYRQRFYAMLDYLDGELMITYKGKVERISVTYEIDIRKYIERKVKEFDLLNTPNKILAEKYKEEYENNFELLGDIDFGEGRQLLPHQQEDVAAAILKPYALMSWETGLGKTMGGLAWSIAKGGKTIVFAPSMNISDPWIDQISKHCIGKTYFHLKKKTDILKYKGEDYLIMSIESMQSEWLLRKLYTFKFRNIIVDESDNIKSKTSIRFKSIRKFSKRIKNKLLMTATPTRNNIAEIYNQLELLCNNSVGMMCYAKRQIEYDRRTREYAEFGCPHFGQPFPAFGGYKTFERCFAPAKLTCFGANETNQDVFNADILEELLAKIRFTRIFEQEKPRINAILGLEDHDEYKEYKQVLVPMSPTEIKVYDYIMDEFTRKLEEFYKAKHDGQTASMIVIMQQIMNLLQGTSHPWTYAPYDLEKKTSMKLEKAMEIIRQAFKEGRKVMMASPWVDTSEVMEKMLLENNFPTFRITSEMSKKNRANLINAFRNHEGPAIITGTFGVLKSGLNLPEVSVVIAESYPWNFAQLHQYAARAIRLNSPEKTTIHCLCSEGSFDINVFALMMKKEVTNTFVKTGKFGDMDKLLEGFGSDKDLFGQAMELVQERVGQNTRARIKWGHRQEMRDSNGEDMVDDDIEM